MTRVAVTGASGNVGTALLRRLAAESDVEVVGVSRRRPPDAAPYAGVRWVTTDLADPASAGALDAAFDGVDAVVHAAWLIQPSHDRERMRRTNVDGTRRVAEAARRAGAGHLVHLSSVGAYSPGPGRTVDESWPTHGIGTSHYSVDKAACERLLDGFADDLTVARMRPTLILQEDAASEISRYFLGRLVPTSLVRPGLLRFAPWPAGLRLQFVHADDVAAAIDLVLRERVGGGVNVAADPVIDRESYAALFGGVGPPAPRALLRPAAAVTWRLRLQPTDAGWLDLAFDVPLLDTGRLRSLGWRSSRSGDETLRAFVAALGRRQGGAGPLLYARRLVPALRHLGR